MPVARPVRLVAQDTRLSRGQQGFESPTGRHATISGIDREKSAALLRRAVLSLPSSVDDRIVDLRTHYFLARFATFFGAISAAVSAKRSALKRAVFARVA